MTPEIEKRIKAVQAGRVPAGYKRTKVGIVPKDWGEVRFHDMFSRVVRKNKEGNTNVLTISAQYGLINQNEFFNKTVASDDKSNYYLMKKGTHVSAFDNLTGLLNSEGRIIQWLPVWSVETIRLLR